MPHHRRRRGPRLHEGDRGTDGPGRPVPAARRPQGILGLRTTYGIDRLEHACAAALAAGDPSYRTIKGILATSADTAQVQAAAASQRATRSAAVPAFLRGPDDLFADNPPSQSASVSATVLHLPTTSTTTTTSDPTSTTGPGTTSDTATSTVTTTATGVAR